MTITLDGTAGITTPTETTTGNSSVGGNLTVTGTASITGNTTVTGTFTATGGITGSLKSGTAQASTSGTSIDFTGIPTGVKRITVMFNGVSTNGTAYPRIQLGSGSPQTTGYLSYSNYVANSSTNTILAATAGFDLYTATASASIIGTVVFTVISGNTWVANGQAATLSTVQGTLVGNVTLSGTLDRIRITTSNGTDTFDAGTINILYE